jgi:hypothetical protein
MCSKIKLSVGSTLTGKAVLAVRLKDTASNARDNPTLGYDKLEGELRKLGFDVGERQSARCCLTWHSTRAGTLTAGQFVACDFFTLHR